MKTYIKISNGFLRYPPIIFVLFFTEYSYSQNQPELMEQVLNYYDHDTHTIYLVCEYYSKKGKKYSVVATPYNSKKACEIELKRSLSEADFKNYWMSNFDSLVFTNKKARKAIGVSDEKIQREITNSHLKQLLIEYMEYENLLQNEEKLIETWENNPSKLKWTTPFLNIDYDLHTLYIYHLWKHGIVCVKRKSNQQLEIYNRQELEKIINNL